MRRFISALLCLALLLSISSSLNASANSSSASTAWDGRSSEVFSSGTGTAEDPYQIANGAQLYQLALIASDSTMVDGYYTSTKDTFYILTANIYLSNKLFPGIAYFSGTLDGAGFQIYDLNIKNTATDYTGFIRRGSKCTLRNLTVNGTVSGAQYTGGIAGSLVSESIIENCANYCAVSGSSYTGGICGYSGVNITACRNFGAVKNTSYYTGGIVGYTVGLVNACINTGTVTSSYSNHNNYGVGGIVGYYGYSGKEYSSLCVNSGDVKGYFRVAGICGYNYKGYFKNCYNIGKISATASADYACGIAFCYPEYTANVSYCYNIGAIVGGRYSYGISNFKNSYCYYLSGTSDTPESAVILTTEDMTSVGAFIGFDFNNTWTWDSNGLYDYPILKDVGLVLVPCTEDTHKWDNGTEVSAPSCTASGELLITCIKCNETRSQEITALGHNLADSPAIPATCTESGISTGSYCTRCDYTIPGDIIPAAGHSYSEKVTASTCTQQGYTSHICTICGDSYTDTYTDALGHNYSDWLTGRAPTCTVGGIDFKECIQCGSQDFTRETDPLGHDWDQGIEKVEATCTAVGKKIYTCIACGETKSETIPVTDHSYGSKITAPTCTQAGFTTHTCTACGDSYTDTYTDALGHNYSDWLTGRAPTCTVGGIDFKECIQCGSQDFTRETDPLGHDWNQGVETTIATCTSHGEKVYTCGNCKETKSELILATGHNFSAKISAPTCTEAGFTTYFCTLCSYNYAADAVPATGHSYTNGSCTICSETDPDYVISNPFTDVKESDYFYTPVLWAVQKGITTGVTKTTFGPEKPCTRGQVVTFLWRACGSPEPTKTDNPFSDVSESAYYYKAVLWAVEQGITTGVSKTSFGPDKTCTRGQVATFLWRAQGKPTPTTSTNPFTDIAQSDYYYSAVLWAVEEGITNGTGKGLFSPDKDCTRGQIVTFLYRALS